MLFVHVNLRGPQIHDHDLVACADGPIGACTIGSDQNTGCATSEVQLLNLCAGGGVHHHEAAASSIGARAQTGDQDPPAIRRELQAVGAPDWDGESLSGFLGGDINDCDGRVLRVGRPDFFSIGRYVKAFSPMASLAGQETGGDRELALKAEREPDGPTGEGR